MCGGSENLCHSVTEQAPLRCDHCPNEAAVIIPGQPAHVTLGIRLTRGIPAERLCLKCARQRGWP